ncbi:proprotein convertase P-domain-containing protein [Aureitalea marina]|uniref:Subtilisin n=1 Tax=Aureitalea marina TaxID=930804 RepID=A0A2S7KRY5_9FLAO|nr:proprotein convertase P-domain-containing protein [Aureitalea marina]PQB05323.1 hypothetical protein BST85_10825 [Aureitalea marina]
MKKITFLLILLTGFAGFSQANDLCVNAEVITGDGTIMGDATGATQTGPRCNPNADNEVWYTFTDTSGTGSMVTLSTCGTAFDTVLEVYSGSCAALNCEADNDDFCGLQSEVTFMTDGSSDYYITVADWGGFGGAGPFTLDVAGFPGAPIGNPPIISCPMNIVVDTDTAECGAVVNFSDATAIDVEDGPLTTTQTMGPVSGSLFPTGDTIIEFEVTDSDMNIVTCQFTITVNDTEDPVAVCQDITIELDAVTGMAMITPMDVDGGSNDNCSIDTMTLDIDTFDCSNIGANTVTLTVTDPSGNSAQCSATVTIEDNTAPNIVCIGQPAAVTDFASVTPGLGIDPPDSVSSVITLGADETITDLNVVLDVSHTWVGDLQITLQSPAGTTVQLFDGSVQDCLNDDILATFDDEASVLGDDECNPGPAVSGMVIPTDALSAFDGESTLGDWTLTITDTFIGFDSGVLNEWGVEYTYDVPATPLDVILDASGMATIDASDLILVIDDNCGTSVTVGGDVNPCEQNNPSNAFENGAIKDPASGFRAANDLVVSMGSDFELTGITANLFHEVGATMASVDFFFYEDASGVPGAQIGSQLGVVPTAQAVVGSNFGFDVSEVSFDLAPFTFASDPGSDTTYWIAMICSSSTAGLTAWEMTSASIQGNETLSSSDGVNWTAVGGGGFDGVYTFSGNCITPVESTISFDCSQLGQNQVNVTVTDAAGNEATCTATVNVIDETAPIITCGPQDQPVSASSSPGTAIPDSDPAGITDVINIAEDQTLNNLTVDLNITHTWVGDLIVTLQSPEGTTVTLVDRIGADGGGFGCSDADLDVTIDDTAASPLEDACTGGGPITGTFTGIDALSAFNGENAQGDWILTVSDNAGGDTGEITSWGINYLTPPTTTEVIIELDENGEAEIDAFDIISSVDEACGISTSAVDIDEFTCADIGTPIVVTAFVSDASGNIAACSATVLVVDNLVPVLTCPEDQTVDPGTDSLFYTVPDYFGNGEATVSDNCTDPITITTQDPAPGTELPDGVYTVTLTAEDENGNVATCSFELTVESILGTNNNPFDVGISVYPNPAVNNITIDNRTGVNLESVMIFDMNGRTVINQSLNNMAQGQRTIDVSALASGVYMVQIQGNDQTAVKRLIKQ